MAGVHVPGVWDHTADGAYGLVGGGRVRTQIFFEIVPQRFGLSRIEASRHSGLADSRGLHGEIVAPAPGRVKFGRPRG